MKAENLLRIGGWLLEPVGFLPSKKRIDETHYLSQYKTQPKPQQAQLSQNEGFGE